MPRSIEVIHTPNPEGIVIYDGNSTLDWFNEGKIVSHDSNNPNIIYLKEGDALWYGRHEIDIYWQRYW